MGVSNRILVSLWGPSLFLYFLNINTSEHIFNLDLPDHINTTEYQSSFMIFVPLTMIVSSHLLLARTNQVEARTPEQNTKGTMQLQFLISKWRSMLLLMNFLIKVMIFHFLCTLYLT